MVYFYNIALAMSAILASLTTTYADFQTQVPYEQPLPLIIGGRPISIREVPYQVGIFSGYVKGDDYDDFGFCGGSILSAIYILTAAHCIDKGYLNHSRNQDSLPKVISGIFYGTDVNLIDVEGRRGILDPDTFVLASSVFFHPDWKIAQPVVLQADQPKGGEMARMTGWGIQTPLGLGPVLHLQQTNMTILDGKSCVEFLMGLLSSDPSVTTTDFSQHICAGSSDGNACKGDSGGPLTIGNRQIGIASFADFRGNPPGCYTPSPTAYTSVAAFRGFIDHVTSHAAVWV